MTTLGTDTFVRANQSGWGTASDGQTWANVFGSATTAIASNHGTIGNLNAYTVYRLGTTQTADIDAVVTLMVSGNALNGAGHAWRGADANNHYRIVTFDNTIYVEKYVSGTRTTITTFAFTITTDSHIKLRVQHLSDQLKVKAWLEGSEPAGWNVSLTEASITAAGYFGLVSDLFGGAGVGVSEYWDYSVTDGVTSSTAARKFATRLFQFAQACDTALTVRCESEALYDAALPLWIGHETFCFQAESVRDGQPQVCDAVLSCAASKQAVYDAILPVWGISFAFRDTFSP